jgi:hypothetical protein
LAAFGSQPKCQDQDQGGGLLIHPDLFALIDW